ncbi:hypothetical protein JCM8547_003485 [Rhodosporidiobolus lusitaniae]
MRQTLSRLSGILPAYLSTSSRAPSASPTASSKTLYEMAQYTPSILDGAEVNATPEEWRKELDALPSLEETGRAISSAFLAHGQCMLVYTPNLATSHSRLAAIADLQGPSGTLANSLKDLGPALMDKYKPKAIVFFSAYWETEHGVVVTDYGDENPYLRDYYGFPDKLYQLKFQTDRLLPEACKVALFYLIHHPAFRSAYPREEHFIPLSVAARAAPEGKVRTVSGLWGATIIVFGV